MTVRRGAATLGNPPAWDVPFDRPAVDPLVRRCRSMNFADGCAKRSGSG